MKELHEIKDEDERVILVAVNDCAADGADDGNINESLDELEELVRTAGAAAEGRFIQNREKIHPSTYMGKGKVEELKAYINSTGATGIVCDDELSPAQFKNLEEALGVKILDRTLVILDIFAKRATSMEGKLQVELAQLRYRSSRLIGSHGIMSRLGGGIGTRGPGEKKLEIDRRVIGDRISRLKKEVEGLVKQREVLRKQRGTNMMPTVAIVGYTNAGKSTLLNSLTNAGIIAEDKLFATLDPTTRLYRLKDGKEILFTDTVGFIRKLPHHLIDAFRSTLEEAKYADIILHVVDASDIDGADGRIKTVYDTLQKLDVGEKPVITFFNKMDISPGREMPAEAMLGKERPGREMPKDIRADIILYGSARKNIGLDALTEAVREILEKQTVYIEKLYAFSQAGNINAIRKYGRIISEEYRPDGIYIKADIPEQMQGMI